MGKGGSITAGYWYKVLYHMGLSVGPIDAFLEFRGGDKTAWSGEVTSSTALDIDQENLWGGEKDQGGIHGTLRVNFGEATQQPDPVLLANLGNQVPGWRGVATVVYNGRYGAMNPYPQKPAYKFRKITAGWDAPGCWYPERADTGVAENLPAYTVSWLRTTVKPYTFATPADVSGWSTNPGDYTTSVLNVPGTAAWSGAGNTGLVWMIIDAAGNRGADLHFDVKVNYDDSGKVIGTSGVQIGPSTPPQPVTGFPGAEGVHVIVPRGPAPFHGYVCFADVDARDIYTGNPLGSTSAHQFRVSSIAVLTPLRGMNPAHILYYARTQSHMGREPRASMNDASFRTAADWYYSQGFGLCTSYDASAESIDEFIQRICKVAGCAMTRSPVDGQWYLDIANGVYDRNRLPILTDDDILEYSAKPTILDSAVNSVSVKYFDPDRKEAVTTAPTQAPAFVDTFGTIQQDLDYQEIPTSALAARVANRDLRAAVTPTHAFELTTTRKPFDWRRNTYFRLQAPKRGIADMVC
ncbi:MAG TPA: hypothetical protein VF277_09245, partial [Steroidobacteraceae bacterium]